MTEPETKPEITFKTELSELLDLYDGLRKLGEQEDAAVKEFRQKNGSNERLAFAQGRFQEFGKKYGLGENFTLVELVALGAKHANE